MTLFIQLVIDGLASGAIYAALALAIVLVNRSTGLINFAQGAMAVVATYIAYTMVQIQVPVFFAILISIVFAFFLGAFIERVIMRRFEGGSQDTAIIVTLGISIMITGFCGVLWGYNPLQFPSLFPLDTVNILGASIGVRALGTIAILIVVVAVLQMMFSWTRLGLSLRAVADNPVSSSLSGLAVGRLLMVGWGMAAALGAIAGALVAPQLFLTPTTLDFVLVYALAACILGGLDSPLGAVVAAMFIGVAENLAGAYIPLIGDDMKIAVPFLLMCAILIVRPQGIFGRKEVSRV